MTAILFVLRTGCQWNALNATGICSSLSAHRRYIEMNRGRCVRAGLGGGSGRLRRALLSRSRLALVVDQRAIAEARLGEKKRN